MCGMRLKGNRVASAIAPDRAASLVVEELFYGVGDARSEFAFEEIEAEVEPRGDAAGGDQIAVIDDARLDRDRAGRFG